MGWHRRKGGGVVWDSSVVITERLQIVNYVWVSV